MKSISTECTANYYGGPVLVIRLLLRRHHDELPVADLSPPTPGQENVPPDTPKGRVSGTSCAQRNPLEDITDRSSDKIEVWVTLDEEIHSLRAGLLAMMLPKRFQASISRSGRTQAIDNTLLGKGLPSYIFFVMSPFLILPFFQITLSSALPQPF